MSRKKETYWLITFANNHRAMEAERFLAEFVKVTVMPTLREISSDCGMSLRIEAEDGPLVQEKLALLGWPEGSARLYKVTPTSGKPLVEALD